MVTNDFHGNLGKIAARSILRFAVQRAIFCPSCDRVLDVRRAVLIEIKATGRHLISCGACFDKPRIQEAVASKQPGELDIIDGRALSKRAPRRKVKEAS